MNHRLALALIALFCILATSVSAQESQWSLTKGDNIIEVTSAGIHVKQRDPKDTNAFALGRKPLHFTDSSAWRVAFDVRYGQLQPVGSTVKLGIGDKLIGAVGADQTGMKVYLGTDTVKFLQPADTEWHHFEFACDGVTSSVWHNGVKINEKPTQGKPDTLIVGAWSEGKWLSRQTELWMRNLEVTIPHTTALSPAPATTLPVPAQTLSPDSEVIALSPDDTNITCQVGDRLQIAGTVTLEQEFDNCVLLVDGSVASTRYPTLPIDHYSFVWTPKTSGNHTLELRYSNFHSKATARRLLVAAQEAAPAAFVALPASAGIDTPVTVSGVGPHPLPLARVDFYFNDKPIGAVTAAPFTATLPIEQVTQPGAYPVKFIAYDAAGHPFHSHTSLLNIPQRVQVTAPRTFTLRSAGDKASLAASVLPGIKVAKISYSIVHADASHYDILADVTSAPFSADVDLSNRASGDYWVRAIATSAAGNSYEAWAVQLTLTNMPDDKHVVQEAKDKAAAEAKAAADAAAIIAEKAKWNADFVAPDVLDANAEAAFKKGLIKVSLIDDPGKVGEIYYVKMNIQNLSNAPVRISPPYIVFDDFSFEALFPEEKDASNVIFVNVNTGGIRQVQFKTLGLRTNINLSRKPTKIRFDLVGSPVLSLPLH